MKTIKFYYSANNTTIVLNNINELSIDIFYLMFHKKSSPKKTPMDIEKNCCNAIMVAFDYKNELYLLTY